ncbi:hypothetical protein M2103_001906 [Ereboglobus sp. PH5-5]|uniref:hypothetical protein n=1 Tax=Ereboglobus sp. PH5-5 TaxID=2940529 RepID=UPI002404E70E|nr:hypothetical protein [Ereboglobus sp. PH5-5]MDF9833674.1 hypothetical protein [Ereboglobus sp. PH5-5]
MKRFLLLCLLPLFALLPFAGCSSKPKPSPLIATEVEQNFKDRWIIARAADLVALKQAADADEAKRIATEEFGKRFAATTVAQPSQEGAAGQAR